MPEGALFREICKPEVLRIGWHLAHADSRDDFVVDPINYEDVGTALSDRLAYIIREIRHERYRPRYLVSVDIPKSSLGVRPGNILPIEEAALLHAIVYLLAPKVDKRLSRSVYSYRLHHDWKRRVSKGKSLFREAGDEIPFLKRSTVRRIDPLEPWYTAWPMFDQQRIAAVRTKGFTHITRTDIASYFENIDLKVLEDLLRRIVPQDGAVVGLLMRILESWTRITSTGTPVGRGIPQGNEVSSFLGNVYLLPLDRDLAVFCRRHEAVWLRYVDDVEVYTKSPEAAREVVLVINDSLRRLYLNLQGSKTEIITGDDLDREVARSEFEAVDVARDAIQKLDPADRRTPKRATRILKSLRPIARRYRRGLPSSVYGLSKRDSRLVRRLMTVYGAAKRPYLRDVAVAALKEPPELAMLQKSLLYLGQLGYRYHDEIVDVLLSLLNSGIPLLPYHAAAMLDCLRWMHPSRDYLNITGKVTRVAFRRRADWPVRQKALELLAILPALEHTALKRAQNSLKHHHPFVRRAAMVMLTRSGVQAVRDHTTRLVHDPDPAVSRLAIHWHRHLYDETFAIQELGRIRASAISPDRRFIFFAPKLWLLSCSPNQGLVGALRKDLSTYSKSKSVKIQWQLRALMKRTKWAEATR